VTTCCDAYGTDACTHGLPASIRSELQAKKREGHTANGMYFLPIKPVAEAIKVILGKPVFYCFAEKAAGKVHYSFKRMR
jgi:hypothetical protein